MFYKLGDPQKQNGITGVVIPIQWSDTEEPFHPFRSSSLIVSAIIQNGNLVIDENDLNQQIDQMEDDILLSRTILPKVANISARFSRVAQGTKSKLKAKSSPPVQTDVEEQSDDKV